MKKGPIPKFSFFGVNLACLDTSKASMRDWLVFVGTSSQHAAFGIFNGLVMLSASLACLVLTWHRCLGTRLAFDATLMSFTWFEERHEGQTLVDDVVTKHVPPHIGLFYCLGGIVFMALVAQFTSGLVLTFYFTPTVDDAYLSVEPLELSRHSGQLFGSVHRWASNLMLLAILLHLSRVYLTGGLKKPRELTWCWVQYCLSHSRRFLNWSRDTQQSLYSTYTDSPSWSCHCLLAAFSVDPKAKCLRTSLEVLEMPCQSRDTQESAIDDFIPRFHDLAFLHFEWFGQVGHLAKVQIWQCIKSWWFHVISSTLCIS